MRPTTPAVEARPWLRQATIRARLWVPDRLPGLIPGAAPADDVLVAGKVYMNLAVVRGLLLEVQAAWHEYDGLVTDMAPAVGAIRDQALEKRDTPWWDYDNSGLVMPTKKAVDFADRWMFGSEFGAHALMAIAAVDALGIDPLHIDKARSEQSDLWGRLYNPATTRPNRESRRRITDDLHRQGWRPVNDGEKLKKATVWVRVYHIHGGESAYLLAEGEEAAPYLEHLARLSHYLEEVDVALGRERRRGRPRMKAV